MKRFLPIGAALAGVGLALWLEDKSAPAPISAPVPSGSIAPASVADHADPLGEILVVLRQKPILQQFAALARPLAHLTPAQMGAVIESLEADPRDYSDYRASRLFKWWLGRDPEAASAWLRPRMERLAHGGRLGTGFETQGNSEMFGAWAKKFPFDALQLARENPASSLVGDVLFYVRDQQRGRPPDETWKILRDFPEGAGRVRETERFLDEWAKKDAASAFAAAQSLGPGPTRDAAFKAVLPELATKDPKLAFEQYNQLHLNSPELVTKMIAGAAGHDPAGIAAWLTTLGTTQFLQAAPFLVDKWAARDPAAAFAWAAEHQVPLSSQGGLSFNIRNSGFQRATSSGFGGGTSALGTAMQTQPEATLAWLHSLPPGVEREQMTSRLLAAGDIDQALNLFREVSPEVQGDAAAAIAAKLSRQEENSQRATDWASTLPVGLARERAWQALGVYGSDQLPQPPPGPDRDAFLSGRVSGLRSNFQSDATMNLILQIGNPDTRHEAFDRAMQTRFDLQDETYQQMALDWMKKADLPAEWKTKWRAK